MRDDQRGGSRPRGLLRPRQALCWLSYTLVVDGEGLAPPKPFRGAAFTARLARSCAAHPERRRRVPPPSARFCRPELRTSDRRLVHQSQSRRRWARQGLHLRPIGYQPLAPTTELHARNGAAGRRATIQVDPAGIEPAFSSSELVVFPLDDRPESDGGARGSRTHMTGVQGRYLAIG